MQIEKKITIINKLGLHARAASKLVGEATRYESQILIDKEGQQADAKSIMSILMLAAGKGTELLFQISGADAEDAFAAVETLINNRFDEDE
ncbi:phosphocarrier protein HPr [Gammaproteobacteria bacterium 45_16_T64]|nr:phosphocarrier protein HPr [Gammaproteobacteria bacterium 45_16_T64]